MVTHLLDSDVCIAWLKGDARVREHLEGFAPGSLAVCSVVKAELLYGARKSGRVGSNLRKLAAFFEPFDSFAFDDAAAEEYSVLRAHLEGEGRSIGSNDMLIAAIALASNVTLATRNVDEFERVPRLQLEGW
jgi:tRNA(fMet)-specific endonuclease VapC